MKKLSLLSVIVILLIAQGISVLGAKEVTLGLASAASQPQSGEEVVLNQNPPRDPDHLPPCSIWADDSDGELNLTWLPPGTPGGDWFSYCGAKNNSIGTNDAISFDVAIRFPADSLAAYAGMSLQTVKFWPAQAGSYTVKVWTGGSPNVPGSRVVNLAVTPTIDVYNTVMLPEPVWITGDQGLWIGYNATVQEGYPAGCDAGPAVNGFGNKIFIEGSWSNLLDLAPSLNYNWCIEGYIGYYPPATAPRISSDEIDSGELDRSLTGYRVWRFYRGQETQETEWISLTDDPITATAFEDVDWADLEDANYRWAIKAIFADGVISAPGYSNSLHKINQFGNIAGTVRNSANQPIYNATVICGDVSTNTNYSGSYFLQLPVGTYSVTAVHLDHESSTQEDIVVVRDNSTQVNFNLNSVDTIIADGFESYPNFAIQFEPWTLVDVDQGNTYGIEDVSWANAHAPQAYIIFNPSATTPPLTGFNPLAGNKMAVCFASTNLANNDWLITRNFKGAEELNFWARSFTDLHGLERFKVGVSTTGTQPSDFTIISGTNYVEAPDVWTEFTYDLAAYKNENIHVGIQCVSNDAFAFMVDNVRVIGNEVSADDNTAPILNTALHTNYPNPFNPETRISYDLRQAQDVKLEIYNVRGQLVRTLVNENKTAGKHSAIWNGLDEQNRPVASGIYYYKLTAGNFANVKKMVLMK
ncbi:MAG TPA: choice-of-anchor J domain-containing protein [Candidatus Cloacimonadota bacterium]|nr:choice-of-anchor J domain-containing protein [Candidatus Cloacimonadota bacterium]